MLRAHKARPRPSKGLLRSNITSPRAFVSGFGSGFRFRLRDDVVQERDQIGRSNAPAASSIGKCPHFGYTTSFAFGRFPREALAVSEERHFVVAAPTAKASAATPCDTRPASPAKRCPRVAASAAAVVPGRSSERSDRFDERLGDVALLVEEGVLHPLVPDAARRRARTASRRRPARAHHKKKLGSCSS